MQSIQLAFSDWLICFVVTIALSPFRTSPCALVGGGS